MNNYFFYFNDSLLETPGKKRHSFSCFGKTEITFSLCRIPLSLIRESKFSNLFFIIPTKTIPINKVIQLRSKTNKCTRQYRFVKV